MIQNEEQENFGIFRECLSGLLVSRLAASPDKTSRRKAVKGRKNNIKPVVELREQQEANDAAELADFMDYLAVEIFTALPADLRTLSYTAIQNDALLSSSYTVPFDSKTLDKLLAHVPPTVIDSLVSYSLLPDPTDFSKTLDRVFASYVSAATAAPPEHTPLTRGTACEICEREHIPLTYHHLIPKQVHTKVLKRGWHKEWELNKVAWLCRACHSFVHKCASNEELAKQWYSVERLMERDDVQAWAKWVGKKLPLISSTS
ncbi:hypothetical protein LTR50_002387 [Elasticomyces elasticus]|nr:hypothetical protein LTR50_002387 [Elasticomyces elasticus]